MKPFKSPYPTPVCGKPALSADHRRATVVVWWWGGVYPERTVRETVMAFVRNCYPEATNIYMERMPGDNRMRVGFDINPDKVPKRRSKRKENLDWTWRYE